MNQKGFASLLLIGLVVILLGVGGYFVLHKKTSEPVVENSQQIDTSPWKMYSNPEYGITFQYSSSDDQLFADVMEGPGSIDDIAQDIVNIHIKPFGNSPEISKIKIQEQEARIVKAKDFDRIGIFIELPKSITLNIEGFEEPSTFHYFEIFCSNDSLNQILSTLKFTK